MIIEAILFIGGTIMDFIDSLNELVNVAGVVGTIAILLIATLIIMIKSFSKQMKVQSDSMESLATAINILTDKVSAPYLGTEQSIILFRAIMKEHVQKKLEFLSDVLEKNSISSRKHQIKKNIEKRFKDITSEEAFKLSSFKSVCGDMGKILEDQINWHAFLDDTYNVFFSEDPIHNKMMDIKENMNDMVNDIAKVLEANGVRN